MRILNFWLHLITALVLLQLVLSGDDFIEEVDEHELPETLDGVPIIDLANKGGSVLAVAAPRHRHLI